MLCFARACCAKLSLNLKCFSNFRSDFTTSFAHQNQIFRIFEWNFCWFYIHAHSTCIHSYVKYLSAKRLLVSKVRRRHAAIYVYLATSHMRRGGTLLVVGRDFFGEDSIKSLFHEIRCSSHDVEIKSRRTFLETINILREAIAAVEAIAAESTRRDNLMKIDFVF